MSEPTTPPRESPVCECGHAESRHGENYRPNWKGCADCPCMASPVTPPPAATRTRCQSEGAFGRCELTAGHDGLHSRHANPGLVTWADQPTPGAAESDPLGCNDTPLPVQLLLLAGNLTAEQWKLAQEAARKVYETLKPEARHSGRAGVGR